jgi:hypothetical protein
MTPNPTLHAVRWILYIIYTRVVGSQRLSEGTSQDANRILQLAQELHETFVGFNIVSNTGKVEVPG